MRECVIRINGRVYRLKRDEVIGKLKKAKPRRVYKYYVEIDGVKYPMRQVAEVALGLPPVAISTPEAYRLCKCLGFEVKVNE